MPQNQTRRSVLNPVEADRMKRARIRLLVDWPWFGQLSLNLRVVETPTVRRMATDGTRVFYNPDWTATQTDEVLAGTTGHESAHCALQHPYRMQGRDKKLWNIACDLSINPIILASGMQLPDDILLDKQYEGMAAETIYAKLVREKQEERERQQREREQEREENETSEEDTESDDTPNDSTEDDEPDESDQGDEDESGEEEGEEEDDEQETGGAAGDDANDEEGDEEAEGDIDDSDGDLLPAPNPNDVAATGDDEREMTAVDWQIVTAQAEMAARKRGTMPADAERAFAETLAPRVDWRAALRQFVERTMPSDYSWSQPNRRYVAQGLYLPAVVRENCPRLVVALDTSGSIDQATLDAFNAELTAIMLEVRPVAIDVVSCDADVQTVETFTPDDGAFAPHPRGGGGTAFQPVFDWVADQDETPGAIIYLTDLDGDSPSEPDVPVLWVTPEWVTAEGPFGTTIRIPPPAA